MVLKDRMGNIGKIGTPCWTDSTVKQIPGMRDQSIMQAPSSGFTVDCAIKRGGQ